MARNILITGCSGGGKSTLIKELEDRGYHVVHEPGLRAIRNGSAKPWEDLPAFIRAATDLSRSDLARAVKEEGPIFYDRGLLDAVSGRACRDKTPIARLLPPRFPYEEPVFYAPPWPEIFENTPDRQLSFEAAKNEAQRIRRDLDLLGITTIELPLCSVDERIEIILRESGVS